MYQYLIGQGQGTPTSGGDLLLYKQILLQQHLFISQNTIVRKRPILHFATTNESNTILLKKNKKKTPYFVPTSNLLASFVQYQKKARFWGLITFQFLQCILHTDSHSHIQANIVQVPLKAHTHKRNTANICWPCIGLAGGSTRNLTHLKFKI